jgi:hypothetical protein
MKKYEAYFLITPYLASKILSVLTHESYGFVFGSHE